MKRIKTEIVPVKVEEKGEIKIEFIEDKTVKQEVKEERKRLDPNVYYPALGMQQSYTGRVNSPNIVF